MASTDTVPLLDVTAAETAAAQLLAALGVDQTSETFRETPRRIVAAYQELLATHEFDMTVFPNTDGYEGLVLANGIPFRSLCEHHLLPFYGVAHVGYLPGDQVLGLSKLARVVEACSRGFQVQERLTVQVASWLVKHLNPRGVGVVVEGVHTCMTVRGVRAVGATTTTYSLQGALEEDRELRREFLDLIRRRDQGLS